MPDRNRENFVVQQFLEMYNSERGVKYEVVARPEESSDMKGTYDFLCKDTLYSDNQLAIEEKSLHLSPINARDNKVIGQLLVQVKERIDEKGIIVNRRYCFFPDFQTTPKKKDRGKYIEKLVNIIERTIREYQYADIRQPINLPVEDLENLKSLRLISARDHSGSSLDFPFHVHSNMSRDVSNDILNALLTVVANADSSLQIPKLEGTTTVLLVTDCMAFGNAQEFQNAMDLIPPELHANIDKVFMVGGNVSDNYSIYAIK